LFKKLHIISGLPGTQLLRLQSDLPQLVDAQCCRRQRWILMTSIVSFSFSQKATQPPQHVAQWTVINPRFPDASFHISGISPCQSSLLTLSSAKLPSLGTLETKSAREQSSHDRAVERGIRGHY